MPSRKRYTRNLGRRLKSPLPAQTTVEWVRFEHEHEPYGVFSYARDARASLSPERIEELEQALAWFSDHLDAPDLLTIERFWFRAESSTYILQARKLMDILVEAGIPIVERRTTRIPGKVKTTIR